MCRQAMHGAPGGSTRSSQLYPRGSQSISTSCWGIIWTDACSMLGAAEAVSMYRLRSGDAQGGPPLSWRGRGTCGPEDTHGARECCSPCSKAPAAHRLQSWSRHTVQRVPAGLDTNPEYLTDYSNGFGNRPTSADFLCVTNWAIVHYCHVGQHNAMATMLPASRALCQLSRHASHATLPAHASSPPLATSAIAASSERECSSCSPSIWSTTVETPVTTSAARGARRGVFLAAASS